MLFTSNRLYLSVVLASSVLTSSMVAVASADEPNFSEMSLSELMAVETFESASLLPTPLSKAPGTVYAFDKDDFTRYGVRRVDELLQYIPGMQLNQYRKRHQSIWARGLLDRYNDKMVLMVDGVRMQHLYYGHFSLGDSFPIEKIERVEVIMGPASSLYGANAFAGIISITTRDFSADDEFTASVEVGSNDRAKVTGSYNSDNLQIFGAYLDQDAPFSENRKSFIGSDVEQPLDEDYANLFIKAAPLKGLTVFADFYENNTPFLFIPANQDAFIEEKMLRLGASYETGSIAEGKLNTRFSYIDDQAREYEKEQVTRALGYEEDQDSTIASMNVDYIQQFGEHVLAIGGSAQYEKAEDFNFIRNFHFADGFLAIPETGSLLSDPDIQTMDYALFIQDVWTVNDEWELTFSARHDDFEEFGSHNTVRTAAVFTPTENQTVKFMYGTAIRTPTYREYLKVLDVTDGFVAPTPEPEEIESFELSYLYQWENANVTLTAFNNDLDNYIVEFPTPDDNDEYYINFNGTVELRGVEAMVNVRPYKNWNIAFGAGYLEVEQEVIDNTPYIATWTGSLLSDYNYHKDHRIGFSLVFNSGRDDFNGVNKNVNDESFVVAKLFGSGSITSSLNYSFGIDNLLDADVYDPAADFGGQFNTEKSEREIWLQLEWVMGR